MELQQQSPEHIVKLRSQQDCKQVRLAEIMDIVANSCVVFEIASAVVRYAKLVGDRHVMICLEGLCDYIVSVIC